MAVYEVEMFAGVLPDHPHLPVPAPADVDAIPADSDIRALTHAVQLAKLSRYPIVAIRVTKHPSGPAPRRIVAALNLRR